MKTPKWERAEINISQRKKNLWKYNFNNKEKQGGLLSN